MDIPENIDRAEFESCRGRAVKYLGLDRNKSSGKVLRKLLLLGFDKSVCVSVVMYLQNIDYINDLRAAKHLAKKFQGVNAHGKAYIMQYLRHNGVAETAAKEAVEALPADAVTIEEALANCGAGTEKDTTAAAKLVRKLLSRGYNYELIQKVLTKFDFMP